MNDFYVGYLPSSPPAIRKRVRLAVLLAVLLAVAGAALFAASQRQFANSFFEYGKPTEFAGTLDLQPFPTLIVEDPGAESAKTRPPYLLVAPGKFGADSILAGMNGKFVRLRGTRIQRAEGHMIEIEPESVTNVQASSVLSGKVEDLGLVTLSGEIVDTKCFLGVMNPGEGKVHRDCAARCLSGGIPPALVTSDFGGGSRLFLLLDENGKPLAKPNFLQSVGQPVSIQGQAVEFQGLFYLRTSPSAIHSLP